VLTLAASHGVFDDEGWAPAQRTARDFWANVNVTDTAIGAPEGALHGFVKVTRGTDRLRLIEP
jgi:hypothetical protein